MQKITSSPSTFKDQTITYTVKVDPGIDKTNIVSLPAKVTVDGAVDSWGERIPGACPNSGGNIILPPNDQPFPAGSGLLTYFDQNAYKTFAQLFTGQLNCTTAAGDKPTFLTKVFNANQVPNTPDYQTKLAELYDMTTAQNLNPVIFVSAWQKESSYGVSKDTCTGFTENFNCGSNSACGPGHDESSDFSTSLTCAINLYTDRENEFKTNFPDGTGKIPVVYGPGNSPVPLIGGNGQQIQCRFADPFLYIIDIFTPTCHYFQESDPGGILEEQTLYNSYVDFYNKIVNSH